MHVAHKLTPAAPGLSFGTVWPMRGHAQRCVQTIRQWWQARCLDDYERCLQASADHADCERRLARMRHRPVSWALTPWV